MNTNLVVVRPFGGLKRGDLISDAGRIATVLAGENKLDVVQVGVATAAPAVNAGGN